MDARRAERLALRDDDDFFDDDDDDDDDDEKDSENDTDDDSDDSEGARYARAFAEEDSETNRVARRRQRRETEAARDDETLGEGTTRGSSEVLRGRLPLLTARLVAMTSEKATDERKTFRKTFRAVLCARCGETCVLDVHDRPHHADETGVDRWNRGANRRDDVENENENENENAFAKCAFCPAEGHVACVFADARDDACAVCARGRDCASSQQKTAGPGARAPPSPAGVRRAFPRRVPDRVRRALESDDDDAWRLE